MAGVSITIDDGQVQGLFKRLVHAAGDTDQALRDIGEYELRATRERAAREESPDGTPWVKLAPRYAARKAKKRGGAPILKFDNHMLGDRLNYQVGDNWVEIGSNVPYGALHQFGGKPGMAAGPAAVPARPWLGLSDQDTAEIKQILTDHLLDAEHNR